MATQEIVYNGSYPNGYPSTSLLKDGGSPTMTAWSPQPISGPTLTTKASAETLLKHESPPDG